MPDSLERAAESRSRPASTALVLATVALDALGFGIVVPVLPTLVMQIAHVSAGLASIWMGGLLAMFSVMQFLCSPLLGALSDRFGRRPVLLVSLGGMSVSYLLLAWAPNLTGLFIARAIAGATAASYSTAAAYIADVTPARRRAQRFGLVGAAFGLGFVIGPAVGGLLGGIDLRLPFYAACALAGLNTLFALVVLPESLPLSLRRELTWSRANPVGTMKVLGTDRDYRRMAIAWCCTWFALGTLQSSFVLANQVRLNWGERSNGLALALAGIGAAVVQGLLMRHVVRALGERWAALAGYAVSCLAYLIFTVASTPGLVYAGILLQALGAISGPSVQAMMSRRAAANEQGTIQGALASAQGLTAIVAPLAGGWVFALFADPQGYIYLPGAPFLMAAVAYLLAIAAISAVPNRVRPGR